MRVQRPYLRPSRRTELPEHIGRVANALFEANGYAQVTMERIADEAGVSKRTLYKYFPVKEALLERLLEAALAKDFAGRDFASYANAGFRNGVTTLLRHSARWCERHADLLLPYIRYKFATVDPDTAPARDRGLLPLWTKLVEVAQARGELTPNGEARRLAIYFHYLYLGALMRWLTEPRIDLRREFATAVGIFMDGVARRQR